MVLPAAAGAAFAAAVGTAQGAPDTAGLIALGPDLMGVMLLVRLVLAAGARRPLPAAGARRR